MKQVWYADDATGGGTLTEVRSWWDKLTLKGPRYSYHPKASKLWLLVKEAAREEAKRVFSGTGVRITTEGKRLLGVAIGTSEFEENVYKTTISPLVKQISRLAKVIQRQPQAAYAAFTHGLIGKWTFLTRTSNSISEHLLPLEDTIRLQFIPGLTGRCLLYTSDAADE